MPFNDLKTRLTTLYVNSKKGTNAHSVIEEAMVDAAGSGQKAVWFYDQEILPEAEKIAIAARLKYEWSVDYRGEKSIKVFGWEV